MERLAGEGRLALRSAAANLAESGRDHDEAAYALLDALRDGLEGDLRGHADDREVHGVGDLEDARVRLDRVDRIRVRVHRVDRALELVRDQVVEDRVADLALLEAGPDDGHTLPAEDPGGAGAHGSARRR